MSLLRKSNLFTVVLPFTSCLITCTCLRSEYMPKSFASAKASNIVSFSLVIWMREA